MLQISFDNINLEKKSVNLEEAFDTPFIKYLKIDYIKKYKSLEHIKENFDNFVIVGIGGSILASQTLYEFKFCFQNDFSEKKFYFLDNIDPIKLSEILLNLPFGKTFFIFISKSGKTLETASILNLILLELKSRGLTDFGKRVCFIGSPNGSFFKLSKELKSLFLPIPDDLPGRYSIFSHAHLFNAYLMDLNLDEFLYSALDSLDYDFFEKAYLSALFKYKTYQEGKNIQVMLAYSSLLDKFLSWYVQLSSESLGKEGKGFTPLKAIGTIDQHSILQLFLAGPKDKAFQFLILEKYFKDFEFKKDKKTYIYDLRNLKISEIFKAEAKKTYLALKKENLPLSTLKIKTLKESSLAQLFLFYMLEVFYLSKLLKVNPFNQPEVDKSKNLIFNFLKI